MRRVNAILLSILLLFAVDAVYVYAASWQGPSTKYNRRSRPKRKKAKKRHIKRPGKRKESSYRTGTGNDYISKEENTYDFDFMTDDSTGFSRSAYWGISPSGSEDVIGPGSTRDIEPWRSDNE